MSKLEQLINELCPDGVEFVKIKDCFTRIKGTPITASKMKEIAVKDGEIRIFAGGKTIIDAYEKDIPKANITRVPSVLVQSRGVIDVVYYDKPFTFKNEMWAYTHKEQITVKYLYYYLTTQVPKMREAASGMGSLPQISLKVTEDMMFPLPPLPIQREIVRILDNFTLLSAELSAELSARKQQYEYYRDYLLSFDDEDVEKVIPDIDCSKVEYKKLSDVTDSISSGKCKEKSNNGKYIVYGSTGVIAYTDSYQYKGNKILIARVGANAGFVHIATGKYDVSDNTLMVNIKEQYNQKYFYYLLVNMNLNRFAKGGGQPLITAGQLKEILVPVPPLEVQNNIVKILDRFDMLCNDISEGIPAEIEARKQQYEYYRDTLLSFNQEQCSQIVNVERERANTH